MRIEEGIANQIASAQADAFDNVLEILLARNGFDIEKLKEDSDYLNKQGYEIQRVSGPEGENWVKLFKLEDCLGFKVNVQVVPDVSIKEKKS